MRASCDQLLTKLLDGADEILIVGSAQGVDVGSWLVARAPVTLPTTVFVAEEAFDALPTLRTASAAQGATAVLAMGDGSACRTEKAPGYLNDRAFPFDDQIAAALADVGVAALRDLNQEEARELLVAGRLVWPTVAQVVAEDPRNWTGDLLHRSDPYGVSYFVAIWTPAS